MQHGLLRQKFTLKPPALFLRSDSPDSPSTLDESGKSILKENNNEIIEGEECADNSCLQMGILFKTPDRNKVIM